MRCLAQSSGSDPCNAGLGDEPPHQVAGEDLSQPPVAVADEGSGRFALDLELLSRPDPAIADGGDVERDPHDAVRVVTAQVGPDETAGNHFRFPGTNPAGNEQ